MRRVPRRGGRRSRRHDGGGPAAGHPGRRPPGIGGGSAAPPRVRVRRREGAGRPGCGAGGRWVVAAPARGEAPAAGGWRPRAAAVLRGRRPGGEPAARAGRRRGRERRRGRPRPGGRRHHTCGRDGADVRHHHRHRRLHRQRRGQPQLLRPQHPHLPRPRRRRTTSTARSSSRSTSREVLRRELAAPALAARARRDGHQHRPVPAGRGPLPADARRSSTRCPTPARRSPSSPRARCSRATCPLLRAAPAEVPVGLGVSIALWTRSSSARLEPGAPSPRARLDAGARDHRRRPAVRGVRGAGAARLTDSDDALDARSPRIAAAGATGVTSLAAAPAARRPGVVPGVAGPRASRSWSRRYAPALRRRVLRRPAYRRAGPAGGAAAATPRAGRPGHATSVSHPRDGACTGRRSGRRSGRRRCPAAPRGRSRGCGDVAVDVGRGGRRRRRMWCVWCLPAEPAVSTETWWPVTRVARIASKRDPYP